MKLRDVIFVVLLVALSAQVLLLNNKVVLLEADIVAIYDHIERLDKDLVALEEQVIISKEQVEHVADGVDDIRKMLTEE